MNIIGKTPKVDPVILQNWLPHLKYSKMKRILLLACLLSTFFVAEVAAQCPGCVINVPAGLPADTIYLGAIPDATVGVYYEQDLSFRLPQSTDPVNANDPSIPAGLTIDEITINSLTNVPPGLAWEVDQAVYIPADETDGCIRFCGTPFTADTFVVDVVIDAVVFGITQSASFSMIMVVNPSVSQTEGFSMQNNVGCGAVEVGFTNNVPSNGNAGYSYSWDFGNGTNSSNENPTTVVYDQPGVYVVNYEAEVDTTGYVLTSITVADTDCNDFPTFPDFSTAPDMHIMITNPSGVSIYDSNVFENTFPPISVSGNWPLEDGDYLIEVIDNDSGINGADDDCGTVLFNKFTGPVIDLGSFVLELVIFHPVSTITSSDTVIVYEAPEVPVLIGSATEVCDGEMITLSSSYIDGNTWYLNGEIIQGALDAEFVATEPGTYSVSYTSADGCITISEPMDLIFTDLPTAPAFANNNNLLFVFDEEELPATYELQWYQEGEALEGENGLEYCVTEFGEYALEVTDLLTGCSNVFTQVVALNPNSSCATSTNDSFFNQFDFRLSPNPSSGYLTLQMDSEIQGSLDISLLNISGKREAIAKDSFTNGSYNLELDLTDKAKGVYFLQIVIDDHVWVERIVLF